jgi:hypothetical protein
LCWRGLKKNKNKKKLKINFSKKMKRKRKDEEEEEKERIEQEKVKKYGEKHYSCQEPQDYILEKFHWLYIEITMNFNSVQEWLITPTRERNKNGWYDDQDDSLVEKGSFEEIYERHMTIIVEAAFEINSILPQEYHIPVQPYIECEKFLDTMRKCFYYSNRNTPRCILDQTHADSYW